ncbi:MAG: hypothetical protein KDA25_12865 [Phycisphaerales bacterium]|nr:hypothetical protein [Phycisphaerales bacterium]
MSSIPSNLARVPNTLASQAMLGALARTSQSLLDTQLQLASGRRVNRPSDDAIAASAISVLDDAIERHGQRLRNLAHGEAMMNNVDAALAESNDLLLEAKSIGLAESNTGSDAATRANQAIVVSSIIQSLAGIGNRQLQGVHYFGGQSTAAPPIEELLGGYRYRGVGDGLTTDLGQARGLPITTSASRAFGMVSERVQGERDLDPTMPSAGTTRLADLNGANGTGVSLGSINVTVGATLLSVDLTGSYTIDDVMSRLETEIQTVDPLITVSVSAAGDAIAIDATASGNAVVIADPDAPAAASDLGLVGTYAAGAVTAGGDLDPRLTTHTALADLTGVTVPLGTIRLENGGQTRDLDLSSADTVEDVMNLVAGLDIGIRVEIASTGDRLNFVNELSGGSMSIGETGGVPTTASELGVRSFTGSTALADFNDGRGVQILSGAVDPVTGVLDPTRDIDFEVTLTDGSTFTVDLAGSETVQDVLDAINAAAPAALTAQLAASGNGIALVDTSGGGGTLSVTPLNGSHAAEDLGIAVAASGATLTGEDRATVAVDSVFTHLIALRDALNANDTAGIQFATEKLEADLSRVTETRAEIGVRTRRIEDAIIREEELQLQDVSLRSQFQDLDYTEAAMRFANLQQQLQAGLATAGRATSLSLLDFIG